MSPTWHSQSKPGADKITPTGWLRVILRGTALMAVLLIGLACLLLLRVIERPLFGMRRPWTPGITRVVCRISVVILGLRLTRTGPDMQGQGAMVANHSSWLDIFVLNACTSVYFVSKSEVATWPGIGLLARATGTVFVKRDPKQAAFQKQVFESRLQAGHRLLFFPEGTSTDGQRVLRFNSTLYAAFFTPELRETLSTQPVSVRYTSPPFQDPRFFGWWGDMDFAPHLIKLLACANSGQVQVTFHPSVAIVDFQNRKALASYCETVVRSAFTDTPEPPTEQNTNV